MNVFRLLKNIPLRLNEERSDQLATHRPLAWLRIYLSRDEFFLCPDDALVIAIWRFHSFSRGGRAELKSFLRLCCGCTRLLDLGASAGIFSALSYNTRSEAAVLSVEPDEKSYQLLNRTALNNEGDPSRWKTVRAVMSDQPGKRHFENGEFGGLISETGVGEEVTAHSLASLAADYEFVPDLIKIDVESYEYEVLSSGLNWLEEHRPGLFLELHWDLLEQRNLSPASLLTSLAKIGYRCRGRADFPSTAARHLDSSGVVRLPLVAPFPREK